MLDDQDGRYVAQSEEDRTTPLISAYKLILHGLAQDLTLKPPRSYVADSSIHLHEVRCDVAKPAQSKRLEFPVDRLSASRRHDSRLHPALHLPNRLFARLVLIALCLCAGCRYSAAPYYGQLLVADARGFVLVQLPSTEETIVAPMPNSYRIYGHPSVIAPGVLVLSNAERLLDFDLKTDRLEAAGPGVWPTYVPEHDLLFFWESREGSDRSGKQVLRARTLHGNTPERIVADFSGVWRSRVVEIAPDQVLFLGHGDRVWELSITAWTLSPTIIEDCLPMAWRTKTRQLVCQDIRDRRIYLAHLNGERTALPIEAYEVLGYSPNYDAVIYSAAYGSPWRLTVGWAILAYSFRDRHIVRLAWTKPGATGILLDREGKPL